MKNLALILIASWPGFWMSAQQYPVPDVSLRDLDGKLISASSIVPQGVPTLVIFWKSTDGKYCENLDMYAEAWDATLRYKGIKMVAICTDCNGSWTNLKPLVNGNDWEFETYADVNGDLKRAMNVGEGPCAMLYGHNQDLLYRFSSACTGSEEFICENILNRIEMDMTAANYKK